MPFEYQTTFDHSNTGLVLYSAGYWIRKKTNFCDKYLYKHLRFVYIILYNSIS